MKKHKRSTRGGASIRTRMAGNDVREDMVELAGDDKLLFADGFDDCIIGLVSKFGQEQVVLYDQDMVIDKMVKKDGMTYEEAEEYFYYNIAGAYVGEKTPAFARLTRHARY